MHIKPMYGRHLGKRNKPRCHMYTVYVRLMSVWFVLQNGSHVAKDGGWILPMCGWHALCNSWYTHKTHRTTQGKSITCQAPTTHFRQLWICTCKLNFKTVGWGKVPMHTNYRYWMGKIMLLKMLSIVSFKIWDIYEIDLGANLAHLPLEESWLTLVVFHTGFVLTLPKSANSVKLNMSE